MSSAIDALKVIGEINEAMIQEDLGYFGIREGDTFVALARSRNRAERILSESSNRVLTSLTSEEYGAVKHQFIKAYHGSGQKPPIFEEKETSVRPPFMDTKAKGASFPKAGKDLDKPFEYERGHTPADALGKDAAKAEPKDIIMVRFQDPRHVGEAMALLAQSEGQPTYELGQDGQSIVFHVWKADDSMKERMKKAVKALKASSLEVEIKEMKQ